MEMKICQELLERGISELKMHLILILKPCVQSGAAVASRSDREHSETRREDESENLRPYICSLEQE